MLCSRLVIICLLFLIRSSLFFIVFWLRYTQQKNRRLDERRDEKEERTKAKCAVEEKKPKERNTRMQIPKPKSTSSSEKAEREPEARGAGLRLDVPSSGKLQPIPTDLAAMHVALRN
jgi:archaellum component FlaD/FlaE